MTVTLGLMRSPLPGGLCRGRWLLRGNAVSILHRDPRQSCPCIVGNISMIACAAAPMGARRSYAVPRHRGILLPNTAFHPSSLREDPRKSGTDDASNSR